MNAVTDGPYIFYQGNRILVRSIITRNGKPRSETAYFTPQQKHGITVNCTFPEHPDWDFSIPLKAALQPEPAVFPEAAQLFAISDIEGNFEAFRRLLLAGGVVDEQYNWTFGQGHLVLNGDCFDRGEHVTECLWLLYGLEEKARQQGGYVHFILGNHEIMNMTHDLRYLHEKYLAMARLLRKDYKLFYTPDTELGRWLATKNIMEKIGPVLFVHGGVSPAVNAWPYSLAELNRICRPWYFMPPPARPAQLAALYDLLFSADAPFWYRGYAMGAATPQQVAATLEKFAVSHIVIGHTTVERVTTFFGGKVIDIDTPHALGISEGLLIEGGRIWRVGKEGREILFE